MPTRLRLVLLLAVLAALAAARAAGALGAQTRAHVSRASAVAREQALLVRFARRFVGARYAYGGTSPSSGFDCSGFTRFVYGHFGIVLPHFSGGQFELGRRIPRASLRPGDLVFFDGLGHVGIYVGADRFIHAPHSGTRVSIESLSGWYGARYDGARRLL